MSEFGLTLVPHAGESQPSNQSGDPIASQPSAGGPKKTRPYVRCGACGHVIHVLDTECESCGCYVTAGVIADFERPETESKFTQLIKGDIPLGRVFWIYNITPSVIVQFSLPLLLIRPNIALVMLAIATAYLFVLTIGIWRSADKYDGPSIWAISAKVVCVASFLIIGALGPMWVKFGEQHFKSMIKKELRIDDHIQF